MHYCRLSVARWIVNCYKVGRGWPRATFSDLQGALLAPEDEERVSRSDDSRMRRGAGFPASGLKLGLEERELIALR
jgi:hypothetical protein